MAAPSKLKIQAYSDAAFSSKVGEYAVLVNPEKYSHRFEISYNQQAAPGEPNVPLKFDHQGPSKVQFELLFDVTGAIPGSPNNLAAEIKKFLRVAYDYQGTIHEPYYLKLFWGDLVFGARLTDLSLQYTLFRPDGTALRAKADVTFTSFIDQQALAKEANKHSADLTQLVTVQAGETLPLLCTRVYGNPSLVPQVARFNGLTNLRALSPGTVLVFPPLQ